MAEVKAASPSVSVQMPFGMEVRIRLLLQNGTPRLIERIEELCARWLWEEDRLLAATLHDAGLQLYAKVGALKLDYLARMAPAQEAADAISPEDE